MSLTPIHDAIGCLVERWHDSDDPRPVDEFLGMSREQFGRCSAGLMTAQELQDWADSRGLQLEEER